MPVISAPQPTTPSILRVSESFSVDLAAYAQSGERDAILASSGMGKSYLTGVLMEETIESGGLLCVIDPEGEHYTLAERYPMLIVGGDNSSLPLDETRFETYLETMLTKGISLLFDLSGTIHSVQRAQYVALVDALFLAEEKHKRKIRVVVDEARIYAPQKASFAKDEANPLTASQNIAQLGRKRGIDSIWATQRPANINKDILSQCNRFWFGGIQAEHDYKAIKTFLDDAGISFTDIKALTRGEFYFYSNGETRLIRVRKRYCKHAGSTPTVSNNRPRASKADVVKILKELH